MGKEGWGVGVEKYLELSRCVEFTCDSLELSAQLFLVGLYRVAVLTMYFLLHKNLEQKFNKTFIPVVLFYKRASYDELHRSSSYYNCFI